MLKKAFLETREAFFDFLENNRRLIFLNISRSDIVKKCKILEIET
jgi:hypothetical protein